MAHCTLPRVGSFCTGGGAAGQGNPDSGCERFGAGADVNATLGSGETPLQTARYSAAPDEVVAALLAAGARE